MIRVKLQAEPGDFDSLVRQPGREFLEKTPTPTAKQFNTHAYWRAILKPFALAYGSVCAYSCFRVHSATGADTVEHYVSKSTTPALAYEWSNYRFVCSRLNGRKACSFDVLDPFQVEDGWFVIEFPTLLVKPSPLLPQERNMQVSATIVRLGLNDLSTCLDEREQYVRDYCFGHIDFNLLRRDAPFLAAEIARQGYEGTLNNVMGYRPEDDKAI